MRGQCFSTPEEAVDAFRIHVLETRQSEWQKCFDNWFKRTQKRECDNFRAISLLNIAYKIIESLLTKILISHFIHIIDLVAI